MFSLSTTNDIREKERELNFYTIDRYNLGPNGGILTSLNLFTTKFDQVLNLVAKRAESVR